MRDEKTTLRIQFDNPTAAQEFAIWLSCQGEQAYWEWMRIREESYLDKKLTAMRFHYTKAFKGGEPYKTPLITTRCGRHDDKGNK